ncbi:hypothetical protein A2Y99_05025 [Candidatus Gottesmanbacteria bacterium RBG_13_37_7]|uniref:GIY-YIG domain-containing protein n=1 Tax=Candidatus Gottesmanbacteria bacterium RBG_13_37_7 TaxID=1798369 RepID=A0A1F5YGP7_9BACT|nr:MAG: hypothetical protein A2Y99_05025 [Candidatus Gottesmanbacteria bacterium RBG_13_37_7]
MHYVYVLKSKVYNYFYTGCTNDLSKRLEEHNIGKVISNKAYKPFYLIYYEACISIKDAFKREKYLKSRLGKNYLKNRLRNWFIKYHLCMPRHV